MPIAYGYSQRIPEVEEEILQRLAEGETLRSICEDLSRNEAGCNSLASWHVRQWARDDKAFDTRFKQAMLDGADATADQIIEIADNPSPVKVIVEKWRGKKLIERTERSVDNVERANLKVKVRQWKAKMANPAIYSDRVVLNGGDPTAPVRVQIVGGMDEDDNGDIRESESQPVKISPSAANTAADQEVGD